MSHPGKQTGRFVLVILAVIGLIAIPRPGAAEPVYEGKAFSEWLAALHAGLSDEELAEARQQNVEPAQFLEQRENHAQEVIRQMGAKGLPTLLNLVGIVEKNRRSVARRVKSRDLRASVLDCDPEYLASLREMAVEGFALLGIDAEPAIPQLTKRLRGDPECQWEVAQALLQTGPKGFAALTNILNNPKDQTRNTLIGTLAQKGGPDDPLVTDLLLRALHDPVGFNRGNAARGLKGRNAGLVVPALLPLLDRYQGDIYTMDGVVGTLSSYGPAASNAAPRLFAIFTNSVVQNNRLAAQTWGKGLLTALKAIDRETAGKAEEFLANSGPLNYARNGYTETRLPNGMVLIAGGYLHADIPAVTNRCLAGAELLDPKTGQWTETGKMNAARFGHKATLLPDGQVLVEGGYGSCSPDAARPSLSGKEKYNPATGAWTVITNW